MNNTLIPIGGFRSKAQLNAALSVHAKARANYFSNPSAENAAKVRAALRKVEREEICQREFAEKVTSIANA